ncbi:MAG: helix-turn-helix domain-containing protein [Candidatus Micrarchaeota archaeon]
MKLPCQITIWYLIPAITAEIVKELKKLGINQTNIAKALGVTPAAVSQYVSGKRGRAIQLTPDMRKRIAEISKEVASGTIGGEQLAREMCELCITARRKGLLCDQHSRISNTDYDCGMCLSGHDRK